MNRSTIDLWVGIECLNCRNDLRRGIVALHLRVHDSEFHIGPAQLCVLQNIFFGVAVFTGD